MFDNFVWLQPSWSLPADIEMTSLFGMFLLFIGSLPTVSLQMWVGTQVIDIYLWLDRDQLVVIGKYE